MECPMNWERVSYEELLKNNVKSERSNNELCTKKLEAFCNKYDIELLHIQDSIIRAIQRRLMESVD